MFDIFYSGPKPNLFAHEQAAASLAEAQQKSKTRYFWWINYLSDYSTHDFLWEPVPWEADQTHVWPSQHQANGGTFLVPKQGGATVNRSHTAIPRKRSVPIIGIDHGDGLTVACDKTTRYISDYHGTLRRVLQHVEDEYVWVVSSVCDYSNFDFTWHPSEWQQDMLHVFPSNEQTFGDTFYIHVPSFKAKVNDIALLEWYNIIHFVEGIAVPRRPIPVVVHNHDTHVEAVRDHTWTAPVELFTNGATIKDPIPTSNLWRELTKTLVPLTPGSTHAVVPKTAVNHIVTQLYDYPYIDKTYRSRNTKDEPLDIVFSSNGEVNADSNWNILQQVTDNFPNRVIRVDGVNGRLAAHHACANASNTAWYFLIPAKLAATKQFDWAWQPDRLQAPKHYIFHAENPINGLIYGHQAAIAYNKKLALVNPGTGLDFSMDQEHDVVPVSSGVAWYADTPWMAWRTAFREVLKLRASLPNVESEYRLNRWLTQDGTPGAWSMKGAEDAVEYYEAVNGDFNEIYKSYEWRWLASYALVKRNLTPD
jgi:hypothetical protein